MHNRIRSILVAVAAIAVAWSLAGPADALERHPRGYVALGDSITAGAGTSDYVGQPYVDQSTYRRVKHRWSYPEQAGVREMGVGGSCLACDVERLNITKWAPIELSDIGRRQTVVAHIGVNDLHSGRTAPEVIAGLQKLRRQVRAVGHRLVFATIVPAPRDAIEMWSSRAAQRERLAVNRWIKTSQPTYVDYAAAVSCGRWLCPRLTDLNDVHVNDAGAARMAKALRSWIVEDRQ